MIRFLIPELKSRRSGGTLYDLQMVVALKENGCGVKTDWISKKEGIKNLFADLIKEDLLIIDGLVFHQNYMNVSLLDGFEKIYLTHLPFWLEPGINAIESESRKKREINFIKKCKLVICTSDFIRDQLIECNILKKNILVINPCIIGDSSRKQTYKKIPTELLIVGSVHYGKGIDILISALNQLENNNWKLNVAGYFNAESDYFKDTIKMIDKSGLSSKIWFLGECNAEKIKALYLNSDLLIQPSRFESYGMAIGEALQLGLPVFASDAGALPSVYKTTPVRFFKTEDVTSLIGLLTSVLNNEGYQLLVQEFEEFIFNTEYKDEYDSSILKLIKHFK